MLFLSQYFNKCSSNGNKKKLFNSEFIPIITQGRRMRDKCKFDKSIEKCVLRKNSRKLQKNLRPGQRTNPPSNDNEKS